MVTRRQYSGIAIPTTTTTALDTVQTSVDITLVDGWPSGAVSFFVVFDPDDATKVEKMLATRTGSTLTLTRGQDGTTARAHALGCSIYPVLTAQDADEANELVSLATTFGRSLIDDADAATARTTLGLANVNNTTDLNKPVSTATQTAIDSVVEIGDLVRSTANKTLSPKWLAASGGTASKATYPALYAVLGDVVFPPNTSLATPSAPPAGAASGCATSANGEFIAIATGAPPFVAFFQYNGTNYTALTAPALLPPGAASGVSCDHAGIYWAVTTGAPNYITLYKRSGTTFTKIDDPVGGIGAAGAGSAFSGDGNYLTVTYGAPLFMTVFARSGDTFTAMTLPPLLDCPTGAASGAAWNYDGTYMTVLQGPPPYALHYSRSGSTLTRMANPAVAPTGACSQASYTNDGVYLFISHPAAPFLTIYKRSGSTFNQIANPDVMPVAASSGVGVSSDGRYVFLPYGAPPFFNIYKKRSNDTFGMMTAQTIAPSGAATVSALSANGNTVVLANAPPPYMNTYRAVATFDQSTLFQLPDPALTNVSASALDTLYYVKAL